MPANLQELYRATAAPDSKLGKKPIVRIYRQGDRWIVIPPSTQDWDTTAGPNPADSTSNAGMMAALAGGDPSDATRATIEAMRAAGIQPGDPVLLMGYSQGGGTASHIGSDPGLRGEFNIRAVVTAGSPTSPYEYPSDVQVLSVENTTDPVPSADGSLNPDRPNVTTVRADAQALGAPPAESGHSRSNYTTIMGAVDESDHPSVVAVREELDSFLNGGQAEVIDVAITRVPAA